MELKVSSSSISSNSNVESRCINEIIRLHVFFEEWFSGSIPNTDQELHDRFTKCMDSKFHLISPRGVVDSVDDLIVSLGRAHGIHSSTRFKIQIKNPTCLFMSCGSSKNNNNSNNNACYLLRYEEWQTYTKNINSDEKNEDVETARLSTVLFQESSDGINNLKWIHVHETWLPSLGPNK